MNKQQILSYFRQHARPALGLAPVDDPHAVSYYGGDPLLPSPAAWPTSQGVAMEFVGQVNLAGRPRLGTDDDLLPDEGLLSLFVEAEPSFDGPAQATLIYTPDVSDLALVSCESVDVDAAPKVSVMMTPTSTTPDLADHPLLDDADDDLLDELYEENDLHVNRLLGHPRSEQGPVTEELPDDGTDWVLLWQWSDSFNGELVSFISYAFVPREDLLARKYDRVLVYSQAD